MFATRKDAERWLVNLYKRDDRSYELLIAAVLETHDYERDLSEKDRKQRAITHDEMYGAEERERRKAARSAT